MSSRRSDSSRSRSRSRERDSSAHIPPANTNSSDPKMMNARIFIGNLATDKVSRSELVNVFGKYGRVLGISMLRGYGFIQYESEEEGRAAVAGENNVMMKGQRIDVKMAAEGRRKGGGGRGDAPPRRSPPPREGRGRGLGGGGRDRDRDRERDRDRDRSPVRGRSRDPYADDAYEDAPPPRRPPARDPYAREPPYSAPPARFPARDPYAEPYPAPRDPYSAPARDPYPAPARPRAPAAPMVADCEIISFSPKLRSYADAIERRLRAVGVVGHQLPLSSPDSLPKALEDITRRGLLFSITVNEQNEQHRSLTLNILHGTPQEHRNMPYEDAITLVQRNYEEYRKKKAEAAAAAAALPQKDFLKPDSKQSYLLNLLADNRFLSVEELDTVIQYLTLRREYHVKKEAAKGSVAGLSAAAPSVTAVLKEESAIVQQQQALQARILNILGGSSAGKTPVTATPPTQAASSLTPSQQQSINPYAQPPPPPPSQPPPAAPPQPSVSATNINFDNPSVQKALNNLISTGGIKSVQSAPTVSAPVAQAQASGSGYEQMYQQQQYAAAYAANAQQYQQAGGAPPAAPGQSNGAAAAAANYAAAVSGYSYQRY